MHEPKVVNVLFSKENGLTCSETRSAGMDPPKEMMVSDVTEDSVTISWIKPMAPFEYYKLSYQSARGKLTYA